VPLGFANGFEEVGRIRNGKSALWKVLEAGFTEAEEVVLEPFCCERRYLTNMQATPLCSAPVDRRTALEAIC
jgi:hypothetical protein